MIITETDGSKRYIPIDIFNTCLIDGVTRKEITKKYPLRSDGAYYLDKFSNYLENVHGLTLKEYCVNYLKVDWPKCPTKNIDVNYKLTGVGVMLSTFSQGGIKQEFCPKFKEFVEKMKVERKGEGNPMFGKDPWNLGLNQHNNEIMKRTAEKQRGRVASPETRQRQSEAYYRCNLPPRHSVPHSPESIEKMRIKTAERWARGDFNRVTSIHIKVREFLKTLDLAEEVQEEFFFKYYSFDFGFECAKVAIEVQGTYFHIDPRIYPNGPTNAMQRRNFGRDKAKKNFADQKGWIIIEVWETEINDGSFKEYLKCKLQELNLLKASE
jgi:G:T-mismatch repair DNA endonuclease (very short patch repair protein)